MDGHSSTGKIPYKIFAAGINGATGLILPKTPVSGPNTTPTAFPVFRDDVIFLFSCKICTYNDLRFTSCALNGPPLSIQDQGQKINIISLCAKFLVKRLSTLRVDGRPFVLKLTRGIGHPILIRQKVPKQIRFCNGTSEAHGNRGEKLTLRKQH